jgi:membrane protein implicated in regulation of membrane protease activity
MKEQENIFDSLFKNLVEYLDAKWEFTKLDAVDKTAEILASLIGTLILSTFFLLFLVLASTGAAYAIGKSLNNTAYGFLIVSAVYLVIFLSLLLFQRKPLRKTLTESMYSKLNENTKP